MPRDFSAAKAEIHTVAFEGDARLTELQMLSVFQLLNPTGVSRYVINVNSAAPAPLIERFDRFARRHAGPAWADRVDVLDRSSLVAKCRDGYRSQQLVKLVAARDAKADIVLMLDGKNHFVRHSAISDFLSPTGRLGTQYWPAPPRFHRYIEPSLAFFDLPFNESMTVMPTITPYLFSTEAVRGMDREVHRIAGSRIEDAFDAHPTLRRVTEFFLHFAYLRHAGIEDIYEAAPERNTALFSMSGLSPAATAAKLASAADPAMIMFGLHRGRLPTLRPTERSAIAQLWQNLSLPEASEYYMELPQQAPELAAKPKTITQISRDPDYFPLFKEIRNAVEAEAHTTLLSIISARRHGTVRFFQVGGNDGTMADPLRPFIERRGHNWTGCIVEPVPRYYDALQSLYDDNELVCVINCACSSSAGTLELHVLAKSAEPKYSRFLKGVASADREHLARHGIAESDMETIVVPALRLDDLFEEHGIDELDVLCIDVEGHERSVLDGLSFPRLKRAAVIYEHKNLTPQDRQLIADRFAATGWRVFQFKEDAFAIHESDVDLTEAISGFARYFGWLHRK